MPRAVAFVGYRGSGKTELIEEVLPELVKRGYRVATIKHVSKRGFTIDRPGKDTWHHAKAGASLVVSLAPMELATIEPRRAKLKEVLTGLDQFDFVLLEGFKESENLAKVITARSEAEVSKLADAFAIASFGARKPGLPSFGRREIRRLVDLIEQRAPPVLPGLDCKHCGLPSCREFALAVIRGRRRWDGCPVLRERVVLKVDGKRVPLVPFVRNMMAETILGMISTLKGAKGKRIELRVVRRAG